MTNVRTLTDYDLEMLMNDTLQEYRRRQSLVNAYENTPDLRELALEASGLAEGSPWKQPLGAFDSYPEGWIVTYEGSEWVSLMDNNSHEPGTAGWRPVVEEGQVAIWIQPSGATDAYAKGDRVLYGEDIWVSILDGNVWVPGEYGWELDDVVEDVETEDDEDEDTDEGEEDGEDSTPVGD